MFLADATTASECMVTSQPPPNVIPCGADTTGTDEYRQRIVVC